MSKIENTTKKEGPKVETAGEATFKKGTNNNKGLVIIISLLAIVAFALFTRTDEGKNMLTSKNSDNDSTTLEEYTNPIYGYTFEFEPNENFQLVVAGSIPAELKERGVNSMQDLNLSDGDALLIRTDMPSGDNIVYTVLELSNRGGYTVFDEYLEALRVNLGVTTQEAGSEYVEKESVAGKDKLPAVEFSFEMDVKISPESEETRVGVFYDTLFTMEDNAYSISFGYPKDIENPTYYVDSYRELVASFSYNEEDVKETLPVLDVSEDTIEVILEDDTVKEAPPTGILSDDDSVL